MPKILSDIELARIRLKLKEGLGRDLTAEEGRLFRLSQNVIKPGPEQAGAKRSKSKAIPRLPKK
jgi:hypothetical protein